MYRIRLFTFSIFLFIASIISAYAQTTAGQRNMLSHKTDSTQTSRRDSISLVKKVELQKDSLLAEKNDSLLLLGFSDQMLENLEVVGQMPKVQVVEDTLIYNADAFRLPEGSVLEELIERIPGAEVSDGKVTINGREVKKILLDGKEFFLGDMNTALKNLPTAIIDKLKHYDEKSDMAKVTGIDDGEERPVIDVRVKKGMNRGYNITADGGYGTERRYSSRLNANMFQGNSRFSLVENANNANDRSTPGRGGRGGSNGRGGGSNGLRASKNIGLNVSYDDKKTLLLDGNVNWTHSDGDALSTTSSESFVSRSGSFSNSSSRGLNRSNGWNTSWRIEWKPTEEWNIQLRPTASINTNDRLNNSASGSFNTDPYLYMTDPLTQLESLVDHDSIRVNSGNNVGMNYSQSRNIGTSLQVNRKFGTNGRNLTFRAEASYGDNEGNGISRNFTHYYKRKGIDGNDSIRYTNRYNETPSNNTNYSLQVTYSEPIIKNTFLQFSYQFQYRNNVSDQSTYDFRWLGELFGQGVIPAYRNWEDYLANVPEEFRVRDDSLSRYSQQKNYIHNFNLSLRFVREKYNLSLGVRYTPQRQVFVRDYLNKDVNTSRTVANISPTMTFRYTFSRQHTLNVDYHGNTSQPSITQMLDITDDSNPQHITMGNPNLKPSYTNNLNIRYNKYIVARRQSIAANATVSLTSNSISNKVTYDDETGARTTQPANINGNWNASGNFLFTSALDEAANWNVSTSTDFRYNHNVVYLNLNRTAEPDKNVTKSSTVSERLQASYRSSWLELEFNGRVNYNRATNELQSNANRETWQYSYGCSFNVKLPWGMTIDTSVNQMSRRGYSDASFNTDEFVWNGQISQDILPKKRLVVSLQIYDILKNQSNYSRQVNENRRSDTWYNSINSYAMLHVVYQLRNFGGRAGRGIGGGRGEGFGGNRGGNRGGGNRGRF